MKKFFLKGLTSSIMLRWLRGIWGDAPTVLMMHRFADPDFGVLGHDTRLLAQNLEFMRGHGYETVRIDDLIRRMARGESVSRCVAFTVDDGYADFGKAAADVFASFECPVTVYVASSFIDGTDWYWWDKVEYVFESTSAQACRFSSGPTTFAYDLSTRTARTAAIKQFVAWGKTVQDESLRSALTELARAADVEVPKKAPPQFAALTWDDCRRLEKAGASFGPHTISHPVLSQVSSEQSSAEMRGSWARLVEEVRSPVPVFCYPYGTRDAFSEREQSFARDMGLLAAVSSLPGIFSTADIENDLSRFALPRYAYLDGRHGFRQIVTGMEHAKSRLRGTP